MMEQTCFQVKKGDAKTFELFYDRIEKFDYVPGHQYVIDVKVTERNPAPQDLSKYIYTLEKVISDKIVLIGSTQVQYNVLKLNGKDVSSHELYFGFDSLLTRISGKSACNTFKSTVKLNKKRNKIQFSEGLSTLMACQEDAMKIEREFLDAISNKKMKIKQVGDVLIFSAKGKEVMTVSAQNSGVDIVRKHPNDVQAGRPEKTAWNYFNMQYLKLIQLDGKTVDSTSNASIIFNMEKGEFAGNNGCNRIFGKYVGDRNNLAFMNVASTKMACLDKTSSMMENRFNEIFAMKGLTVDFAEQVLNIYDPAGNLIMMFAVIKEN
jgi:heat shock protein HslJ